MTGRRTRSGGLEIADWLDRDVALTILPALQSGAPCIRLLAVDRDTDQRVEIHLSTDELDALAAEVLRLREEGDI